MPGKRKMPTTASDAAGKTKAKKEKETASGAASTTPTDSVVITNPFGPLPINSQYHAKVMESLRVITTAYPTLELQDPLPKTGDSGFMNLVGHGAPFNGDAYNERFLGDQPYSTHINFLHQMLCSSVIPYLPLYWERVDEYSEHHLAKPAIPTTRLTLLADFGDGINFPRGRITRVSPCEPQHALLLRFANRIKAGAPAGELQEWIRLILSYPVVFMKLQIAKLALKGAD